MIAIKSSIIQVFFTTMRAGLAWISRTHWVLKILTPLVIFSSCSLFNSNDDTECDPHILNCSNQDPVNFLPTWFGATAWHPDGEWIAAQYNPYGSNSTDPEAQTGIWLIDAATGQVQETPLLEWGNDQDWSPDGKHLVVHQNAQIYTIPVLSLNPAQIDTAGIKQLTTEGRNFYPAWSPDGKWIAYSNTNCGFTNQPPAPNSCGVLILNLDNGTRKLVKRYSSRPTWKSKNEVTFVNREVLSNGTVIGDSFWTYNLSDSSTSLLALVEGENGLPKYSPDGTVIAFHSAPPPPEPAVGSIWRMNSDGSQPQKISPDWSNGFSWRPDGKQIVFVKHNPYKAEQGNGQLWLMNPDGSGNKQLTFNHGLKLERDYSSSNR